MTSLHELIIFIRKWVHPQMKFSVIIIISFEICDSHNLLFYHFRCLDIIHVYMFIHNFTMHKIGQKNPLRVHYIFFTMVVSCLYCM